MTYRKKKVIIVACVLIALPLLYVPTKFVAEGVAACKQKHDSLRLEKRVEIDATDRVEILPGGGSPKTHVSTHGGCDGINPLGITISKSYDGEINGGDALGLVRSSLKNAGYTFTSENFGSEGCKAIYRAEATNNEVKMYVALSQKNQKIADCSDGYPTGISEGTFKQQTIDKALVTPKCGNSNCL